MCLPKQRTSTGRAAPAHISVNDRPIWGIKKKHFTLWLFNIAMENGPFIDGLPGLSWVYLLKMVIFHGYVTNNQMVPLFPPMLPPLSRCVPMLGARGRDHCLHPQHFPSRDAGFRHDLGIPGPLTWVLKPYWAWEYVVPCSMGISGS